MQGRNQAKDEIIFNECVPSLQLYEPAVSRPESGELPISSRPSASSSRPSSRASTPRVSDPFKVSPPHPLSNLPPFRSRYISSLTWEPTFLAPNTRHIIEGTALEGVLSSIAFEIFGPVALADYVVV